MAVRFSARTGAILYTEQMDAEGLGHKLLLTPTGDPRRDPEKPTVGTVTTSHTACSHHASTFELAECRHRKEGLPGPRRGFWVPSGT